MTVAEAKPEPADAVPAGSWRRGVRRLLGILERMIAVVLWAGVLTALLWVAFAWVYPQDLRETRRVLQVLNVVGFGAQVFQYHIGLACLAAAVVALAMRRWRLLALALLVALPTTAPELWSYRPKSPPPAAGQTLRIASVNILFMNFSPHYILPEMQRVDADVILFQEWHTWHEKYITDALSERYPHQLRHPYRGTAGMAIFSRLPLEQTTPEFFRLSEGGMRLQRAVVHFEGRPIALYNVHPISPGRPGAMLWNQRQTAELIDALREETIPCIVAGDFNAHTHTANLAALEELGLVEVHHLAGRGRGDTWIKRGRLRHLPGFRIDHIFISPELTAVNAEVGEYHGSDHLGVFADIGWRGQVQGEEP